MDKSLCCPAPFTCRLWLTAVVLITCLAYSDANAVEKRIEYGDPSSPLIGHLFTPTAAEGKRPAVIVFSDWMGVGEFAKVRAKQLNDLGYIAFVADIYGGGKRAADQKEAGELATKFKSDRELMRARAKAAFDTIVKQNNVDPKKIAAIGFCFGGTVALELARDGAPLAGLVSFHGGLSTPTPADASHIHGRVLVLHGADDPYVPDSEVQAFEEEMRGAGVEWQLVKYGGAVHAFTNPEAGNDPSKGAAYNKVVAEQSYRAMKDFFHDLLG